MAFLGSENIQCFQVFLLTKKLSTIIIVIHTLEQVYNEHTWNLKNYTINPNEKHCLCKNTQELFTTEIQFYFICNLQKLSHYTRHGLVILCSSFKGCTQYGPSQVTLFNFCLWWHFSTFKTSFYINFECKERFNNQTQHIFCQHNIFITQSKLFPIMRRFCHYYIMTVMIHMTIPLIYLTLVKAIYFVRLEII